MQAKNRVAFSKRIIAELECPANQDRQYWYDIKTPGFCVCVTRTRQRVFYLYRWFQGRPLRHRLGSFPELSVDAARKLAIEAAGDLARGIDVTEKRKANRNEPTLGQLWRWYLVNHSKPHKRTWKRDESRWDRYLKRWKGRTLSRVTPAKVHELFVRTGDSRGTYAANQLLELIRHMFEVAAPKLGWEGKNPAHGIQRFQKIERERFLDADELARFMEALEHEGRPTTRDFIKMLLFTGARRSNVASMRWADINFKRATWTVPRTESKSKASMTIHLPPEAIEILTRRNRICGDTEFVFASTGSRTGHIIEPKFAWKKILGRAGIEDLRVHDLRRTLGSWQAAGGASLLVIGKSLGHKNPSSTAIYARLQLDPVKASVNAAVTAMLKAAKVKQKKAKRKDT